MEFTLNIQMLAMTAREHRVRNVPGSMQDAEKAISTKKFFH